MPHSNPPTPPTGSVAPRLASAGPDAPTGRSGFRQAVASEWTKIYSLRSMTWTLVAMVVATVGIAVLVAATGSLGPDDTVLAGSLANAVPGQLAAGILGALVICGEYGSRTIHLTFAACPRRLTVLAAKALVVTALVFVAAFLAAIFAYQIGAAMLAGKGHPPGAPMPALFGVALSYSAVAVLGLALGTALRQTAGAITAVIGLLLLPTLLGPLLGDWQRWVVGTSSIAALQKLTGPADAPDVLAGLGAWQTLWVVCAYSIAALAASAWLLRVRDA